jgi:hypothetical protein
MSEYETEIFEVEVPSRRGGDTMPPLAHDEETEEKPKARTRRPTPAQEKAAKAELKDHLQERLTELIVPPLSFVSPLGAFYFDQKSERTSIALIRMCERSPRARKALERFIQGSAAIDIAQVITGTIVAVQVDRGQISVQSMLSKALQIPELYLQLYDEFPAEEMVNTNGDNFRRGFES